MIILQKFGFKESKYERPKDVWVCGRLADGKPCDLGPGLDGRCCVTTACQPRLENDRWQCRRSANAGGPCQSGPLPDGQCCTTLERCVPVRSLRAKRKRATLAAMALTVGALAVAMAGETGRHFMMPGKLSSHHAGLSDCSACHSGAKSGQIDLLHRLVTKVEPRQNSNLCVTCHTMGTEPFAPHTHPVDDLKRYTDALARGSLDARSESLMQRIAFSATTRSAAAGSEIQCATCHTEHRGVFADLKTVSNQRCQTCHVARFGAFADSHPEFGKFPYRRRPRISFDHQSHNAKHLLADCGECHRPGSEQEHMAVRSFTAMCSACHANDITGRFRVSGPKGIDVIAVPKLDLVTLGERGIDIGGWPEDSTAAVSPFMRPLLLKSSGEDTVSAVARLNLHDLSKATDQELTRVAALAWAVKRLFSTLKTTNPAAAPGLTGNDPKRQLDIRELAALTGGMPRDVVVLGSQQWFPNLQDDLQRHDRGEPTSNFKPPAKTTADAAKPSPSSGGPTDSCNEKPADATTKAKDAENWALTGGWYREDCAIRYRPAAHADPFLKIWLDFSGSAYGTGQQDQLAPIFEELANRDDKHDPIGRCTKCHSVDDQAGSEIINWRPLDTNAIGNRFTNFSHKPHIELIGGTKTCLKCHALQDGTSEFQKSYKAGDTANYTPNFKHLDKAVCASCHGQQAAWESCTLCHGYHVPDVDLNAPAPVVPASLEQSAVSAAAPQAAPPPVAPAPSDPSTLVQPAAPPANNDAPATADKPAAIPTNTPASPDPTKLVSAKADEPADLDGLLRRGLQRAAAGDFELAIEDFSEVIRRDPQHAAALNNRCWSLAALDEVKAALSDCDAALRIAPNFSDALDSRGLVNLKLGFYKQAIADYNSALLRNPVRASALYGRGIAKRRSGRAADAKDDIDAAKRIQPTIVDEFASRGIQ
jgi:hypothetical protein